MSVQSLSDEYERFLEEYMRSWNEGDLDTIDDFFAEDVVVHNFGRGEVYEDREAFKRWVTEVRDEFPDFHAETTDVVVGDDTLVARWRSTGTHEGAFVSVDVEPTNRSAEWDGVSLYRFEDGMVVESWWYYDMFGLLSQLGAIPADLTE